jgi:hypothetical protein
MLLTDASTFSSGAVTRGNGQGGPYIALSGRLRSAVRSMVRIGNCQEGRRLPR